MKYLEKIARELELYEHPFFEFIASDHSEGVEVCIRSKMPEVLVPEFHLTVTRREIEHYQFRWSFQALLYGCLNDYVVELFTKSPVT